MSIYLYVIQACMSGPVGVSGPGHTLAAVCQGLHPLPVMFQAVLELVPGVRSVIRLSSSACGQVAATAQYLEKEGCPISNYL